MTKPSAQRHCILVAEDNADVGDLITKVLNRAGYDVDAAKDGALAWDMLQIKNYDLLITDDHMPKLTGIELVKKAQAARMALPVILMSGSLPLEMLKEHSGLQVNATLPKPYDLMELLNTVKEVLRATVSASEQN
ncbi:MAG: response regulator [Verrucomicrobiota bacterium]